MCEVGVGGRLVLSIHNVWEGGGGGEGFCLRGYFGGLGPIGFVCLHTTSGGYWWCRLSGGFKGGGI